MANKHMKCKLKPQLNSTLYPLGRYKQKTSITNLGSMWRNWNTFALLMGI